MLHKVLNPLAPVEAMELLIDKLNKTKSNAEFLGWVLKARPVELRRPRMTTTARLAI